MTLLLLILLPALGGILSFFIGNGSKYLGLGIMGCLIGLAVSVCSISLSTWQLDTTGAKFFQLPWLPDLGASFTLVSDRMSAMLCLLTSIVGFVIFMHQMNKTVDRPGAYYGLILLSIAGINGVFLAGDALLFYFFWELALIPVYFLCSRWGGERRIPITFKFFIYTFVGSLFMLAGLIYIYQQTTLQVSEFNSPDGHSFAFGSMIAAASALPESTQLWLFPMILAAFAVKMPIFPFHTWQPDTYQASPTPVTIILSALMVKMGIYGVLRWLLPMLPAGALHYSNILVVLSIVGIVYASLLAMVQTDAKRLVAYSSIAHMGLMAAVAFSHPEGGVYQQGILVQMFNHGISITGMWLLVHMIETRYGTRDLTKLGGMASAAPWMAIALVLISFANIALPLTNGFVGEFMLFHGLFQSPSQYAMAFMVVAGLGVILGAVYTLTMVQRVAFGNKVEGEMTVVRDLTANEWVGLSIIIGLIIFLGVYPAPLLNLTAI